MNIYESWGSEKLNQTVVDLKFLGTRMKHARLWTFRVQADTQPGELVGVTGNIPELGEWKITEKSKVVLLRKDASSPNRWVQNYLLFSS